MKNYSKSPDLLWKMKCCKKMKLHRIKIAFSLAKNSNNNKTHTKPEKLSPSFTTKIKEII
jgi:hypothetical protein